MSGGVGGNATAIAVASTEDGTAHAQAWASGGKGEVGRGGHNGVNRASAYANAGGVIRWDTDLKNDGSTAGVEVTAQSRLQAGAMGGRGLQVGGELTVESQDESGNATTITLGSTSGMATFTQTGGTHNPSESITVASNGVYAMSGGEIITPVVVNEGTFEYSAGSVTANVTNHGTFNVRGGGVRTITGDFTNAADGTIKTWDTTLEVTGTFTNDGTYNSDPADNVFASLMLGRNGVLRGGTGDRFIVSQDLLSTSENAAGWETRLASLLFAGSARHDLGVTGVDLGAVWAGYNANFAWGKLSLAPGESLTLLDGDGQPGGALYVGILELGSGLQQLSLIQTNGLNIYYDPASNPLLGARTFSLTGGGQLAPVPEPSACCSLLAITGMMAMRRRRIARVVG